MAMISTCMATALIALTQPVAPASGSARIAVVDVPVVSEQYVKTRDLEDAFEQRRASFSRQRDALRDKIERTARSLQEELKPGTAEFDQRRKQLALYETELKWFAETEGEKIEADLAASLRNIYNDIASAVRKIAEERGIDIVLAADRIPDERPPSPRAMRQQIVLQKVVFWSPRVDITDEVVASLNTRYKAQRPASPSGVARPPSAARKEGEGTPVSPPGRSPGARRP